MKSKAQEDMVNNYRYSRTVNPYLAVDMAMKKTLTYPKHQFLSCFCRASHLYWGGGVGGKGRLFRR